MNDERIIRVAIIDDHDALRSGICQFLGEFGFRTIFEAENGQVALEKLENSSILPDVCIVDINMPVMNGFETAKNLHERYPGIKILAFSIYDEEDDVIGMLRNGAKGYILKGADPEELKKAIETVYNNGSYFSAGVGWIVLKFFK